MIDPLVSVRLARPCRDLAAVRRFYVEGLGGPVDEDLVRRLEANGGTRVSQGEYWDRWGVTLADPDGYRLVLSSRSW
jgi:catechol 2,3-dioxygenase-like lactoylglutathione lyase family enzyme